MKAIKAVYRDGRIHLTEPAPDPGPVEVLVVFPEDDPWQRLLDDPTPRPALVELVKEVRREQEQGKTRPLDLGDL
jgi:hypothetical protein